MPDENALRSLRLVLRLLTVGSGMVDAVCFLGLGRVFTANMTGNVLLLGFAAAGVPGLSVVACGVSVGAFVLGAAASGRIARARASQPRWFLLELGFESILIGCAAVIAWMFAVTDTSDSRLLVIACLALAMGGRNAAVRRLDLPDMTTTVLTATLTGLGVDSRISGSTDPAERQRLATLGAILLGAILGAAICLRTGPALPLLLAAVAEGIVTVRYARLGTTLAPKA